MGENIDNLNLGTLLGNLGDLKLDSIMEVFGDLGDSLAENVEKRLVESYLAPILDGLQRLNNEIAQTNKSLNKLVEVLKKK